MYISTLIFTAKENFLKKDFFPPSYNCGYVVPLHKFLQILLVNVLFQLYLTSTGPVCYITHKKMCCKCQLLLRILVSKSGSRWENNC